MLNETFKKYLSEILDAQIKEFSPLYGGDINDVYKVETFSQDLIIKVNSARKFPNMFELEALGLQYIADSNSFATPKVIKTGYFKDQSFILLEYLQSGNETTNFSKKFFIAIFNHSLKFRVSFSVDFFLTNSLMV